jgi:phage terminase Nu1 subunit (DNA packaging protein)
VTVTRQQLAELCGDDLMFADGLDDALIGVVHRFGQEPVALYDRAQVIELLADYGGEGDPDDQAIQDAEEYFAYNVIGAWVGDRTPAFAELVREEDDPLPSSS